MSGPDFHTSPAEFPPEPRTQPDAAPALAPLVDQVPMTAGRPLESSDGEGWADDPQGWEAPFAASSPMPDSSRMTAGSLGESDAAQPRGVSWVDDYDDPRVGPASAERQPDKLDELYETLRPPEFVPPAINRIVESAARLGPYLASLPEQYPPDAAGLLPAEQEVPGGEPDIEGDDDSQLAASKPAERARESTSSWPAYPAMRERDMKYYKEQEALRMVPEGWLVSRSNYMTTQERGSVISGELVRWVPIETAGAIVLLPDGGLAELHTEYSPKELDPRGLQSLKSEPLIDLLDPRGIANNDGHATRLAEQIAADPDYKPPYGRRLEHGLSNSHALAASLNTFIEKLGLPDDVLDELFPNRSRG